jgi:glyoxylase-like metal-dependent hydrolase (beta-lactamase superfamily II)
VPGYCGLGERELELHPADGHTVDGMAIWIPWAKVLVCGDYLSPVEIPTPEASIEGYLATLARLEQLVEEAEYVICGHGGTVDPTTAQRLLLEDREYLEVLREERRGTSVLPKSRRDGEQRRLHEANVARLRATS